MRDFEIWDVGDLMWDVEFRMFDRMMRRYGAISNVMIWE